jgi:hypothetical protein
VGEGEEAGEESRQLKWPAAPSSECVQSPLSAAPPSRLDHRSWPHGTCEHLPGGIEPWANFVRVGL